MLTPQEVTNVVFEKAVFGGYEINAVDKFLNQLTKDYSALYRDNELMKNRLSAMADKIEEYRVSEDAMRLALLSAKKTARELAEKAKAEPEVQNADETVQMENVNAELAKEMAALRRAKEATAAYLMRFREATAACEAALIDLYGEPVPESAAPENTAEDPAAAEENAEAAEAAISGLDFTGLDFSRN